MFSEKCADLYVVTDQLCIFPVIPVVKQWALSFDSRKLIQKILKDNSETLAEQLPAIAAELGLGSLMVVTRVFIMFDLELCQPLTSSLMFVE